MAYNYDVDGALAAGYTPRQIADYVAKKNGYDAEIERRNGYSDEEIIKNITGKSINRRESTPESKQGGVFDMLKKGTASTFSQMGTGAQALFGDTQAAGEAGAARSKAIDEKYGEGASLDKLKEAFGRGILPGLGELPHQMALGIAEQLPNIGTQVGGRLAGAGLGAGIGAMVPALEPVTMPLGAAIGFIAPSYLQIAGSNVERQVQEGKKASAAKAFGAAVPQTALDVVGDRILLGNKIGGKLFGPMVEDIAKVDRKTAEAMAKESLKRSIATGTIKGIAGEVPTEVAQQAIERAQAGLDLTSPDAWKEYGDTAYATALLGPLGAVGQIADRSAARSRVAELNKADAEAAAQQQNAATPPPPPPPATDANGQAPPPATGQNTTGTTPPNPLLPPGVPPSVAAALQRGTLTDEDRVKIAEIDNKISEYQKLYESKLNIIPANLHPILENKEEVDKLSPELQGQIKSLKNTRRQINSLLSKRQAITQFKLDDSVNSQEEAINEQKQAAADEAAAAAAANNQTGTEATTGTTTPTGNNTTVEGKAPTKTNITDVNDEESSRNQGKKSIDDAFDFTSLGTAQTEQPNAEGQQVGYGDTGHNAPPAGYVENLVEKDKLERKEEPPVRKGPSKTAREIIQEALTPATETDKKGNVVENVIDEHKQGRLAEIFNNIKTTLSNITSPNWRGNTISYINDAHKDGLISDDEKTDLLQDLRDISLANKKDPSRAQKSTALQNKLAAVVAKNYYNNSGIENNVRVQNTYDNLSIVDQDSFVNAVRELQDQGKVTEAEANQIVADSHIAYGEGPRQFNVPRAKMAIAKAIVRKKVEATRTEQQQTVTKEQENKAGEVESRRKITIVLNTIRRLLGISDRGDLQKDMKYFATNSSADADEQIQKLKRRIDSVKKNEIAADPAAADAKIKSLREQIAKIEEGKNAAKEAAAKIMTVFPATPENIRDEKIKAAGFKTLVTGMFSMASSLTRDKFIFKAGLDLVISVLENQNLSGITFVNIHDAAQVKKLSPEQQAALTNMLDRHGSQLRGFYNTATKTIFVRFDVNKISKLLSKESIASKMRQKTTARIAITKNVEYKNMLTRRIGRLQKAIEELKSRPEKIAQVTSMQKLVDQLKERRETARPGSGLYALNKAGKTLFSHVSEVEQFMINQMRKKSTETPRAAAFEAVSGQDEDITKEMDKTEENKEAILLASIESTVPTDDEFADTIVLLHELIHAATVNKINEFFKSFTLLNKTIAEHKAKYDAAFQTLSKTAQDIVDSNADLYRMSSKDRAKLTKEEKQTIFGDKENKYDGMAKNSYEIRKATAEREEIEPVQHLVDIYDHLRRNNKALVKKYGNAFSNVYEFISYALTDEDFQSELNKLKTDKVRFTALSNVGVKRGKTTSIFQTIMDIIQQMLGVVSYTGGEKKKVMDSLLYGQHIEGNVALEVLGVFEAIAGKPISTKEDENFAALAATPPPTHTHEQAVAAGVKQVQQTRVDKFSFTGAVKFYFSSRGLTKLITSFENKRRAMDVGFRDLERMGLVNNLSAENGGNHVAVAVAAGAGNTQHNLRLVQKDQEDVVSTVRKYAELSNIAIDKAMSILNRYFIAITLTERRLTNFLEFVPLDATRKIFNDLTAAQIRQMIFEAIKLGKTSVDSNTSLTPAQRRELQKEERKAMMDFLKNMIVGPAGVAADGTYDPNSGIFGNVVSKLGYSPAVGSIADFGTKVKPVERSIDYTDDMYNILSNDATVSYGFASINSSMQAMNADPHLKAVEDAAKAVQKLNERIKEFQREANIWTERVDAYSNFYGWKNYFPLRGTTDAFLNRRVAANELSGTARGGAHSRADPILRSEGRKTKPDNIIQSAMAESTRAATQAGFKDLVPTIANAIDPKEGKSVLKGKKLATIKFEERQEADLGQYRKNNTFLLYKPDGSIEVYEIKDKPRSMKDTRSYALEQATVNGIRPEFKPVSPPWAALNSFTSLMGQMHTRFQGKFAPFDFIRNTIYNALILSMDYAPKIGMQYATLIAKTVMRFGLVKTARLAKYYSEGDFDKINKMRGKGDKFIDETLEWLEGGGRISILSSFSTLKLMQSQYDNFEKGNFTAAKDVIVKYADTWMESFEFLSRAAAYSVIKEQELAKLKNNTSLNDEEKLTEAKRIAALTAKNLSNFEHSGNFGSVMGALYTFFRASMVGAVRAGDSLYPYLRYMGKTPTIEQVTGKLDMPDIKPPKPKARKKTKLDDSATPEQIEAARQQEEEQKRKDNEEAKAYIEAHHKEAREKYYKDFLVRRKNARMTIMITAGFGSLMYTMAMLAAGGGSDDDDEDKNKPFEQKVKDNKDDMQLWSRNMRIPLGFVGGDPKRPLQIPWGFGPAAFAAASAQLTAVLWGKQGFGDAMGNIVSISVDSFLPLPIARFNPLDQPAFWLVDSVIPSPARPFVEYTMNIDGLGRGIAKERNNKYGPVYSGGENVPEIYKDVAKWIYKVSGGEYMPDPNVLRYLASSWVDGPTTLLSDFYNTGLWMTDQKDFDPKTDLFILSNFVGSKASLDAREFTEMEKKVLRLEERLNAAKERSDDTLERYTDKHPNAQMIVGMYRSYISEINRIRSNVSYINAMDGLTPKERKDAVEDLYKRRDATMRSFLDQVEDYGGL